MDKTLSIIILVIFIGMAVWAYGAYREGEYHRGYNQAMFDEQASRRVWQENKGEMTMTDPHIECSPYQTREECRDAFLQVGIDIDKLK